MLNIENDQAAIAVDESLVARLETALVTVTSGEAVPGEVEVSLLFVDDEMIREVNREHRGIDAATDVLSFPALDYDPGRVYAESYSRADLSDDLFLDGRLVLGDVLISGIRAKEQATDFGHSLEREVVFLFVHSLLHLLGYDHMTETERDRMTAKERNYMDQLGVGR